MKHSLKPEKEVHELVYEGFHSLNLSSLAKAFTRIIRSGRVMESAYGIYCTSLHQPSTVIQQPDLDPNGILVEAMKYFQARKRELNSTRMILRDLTGEKNLNFLFHGYVINPNGFVIGEYAHADNSARLFIKHNDSFDILNFYQEDDGVRHIHSIFRNDNSLFISTGDTKKYLDQWELDGGRMIFIKRILHNFSGGFTGCCKVQGKIFFGTDYCQRPNYIYCLETSEKYFFPRPAYNQYNLYMLPVENRYIACLNQSMPPFSPDRSICIFDAQKLAFVYCQGCSESEFDKLLATYR